MTDEIRLTRKEWDIVEYQCDKCKYWSYLKGCQYPAVSPEPILDCLVPEWKVAAT